MENVMIITEENFEAEVQNSTGLALLDFWAPWCGPCQMMLPLLSQFADEMKGTVKVGKVNVDENPSIAWTFRVMSIPTLILLKDGKAVEMVVGVQQVESLKNLVAKHSA